MVSFLMPTVTLFCPTQGGGVQTLKKVEISLSDCLACSGCITSAESVLITQQSQEQMIHVFEEKKQLVQVRSKLNFV